MITSGRAAFPGVWTTVAAVFTSLYSRSARLPPGTAAARRETMMKRILFGVMVVMVTAVVAGPVAVAQETYKIGAVLSVTGPASYLGEDERNTLQLLSDQVNARGGIGGKKVEVVIYDDASDPTKSVTALRRLHEEDKVLAVIGGSISGNSLAMIPFSEKAGVPQLVPAASAKISNPIKKWVFQFCSTDIQSITLILNFLKAKGITSIAMLADSTAYGVSGKEELERQAPGQGSKWWRGRRSVPPTPT